ncbi:hypothetical protein BJ875DRAFT_374899 [Amylocarpus encephaloides]|uniref:Uncharacterized protein n=1 Tax=Amylocarpus encephaloides TaxID=45428 RepID=A0A9P7YL64_9HELO|nr:hypothetical protein BJ875DRAFT_374899 [Amylocarpus encephaloides]
MRQNELRLLPSRDNAPSPSRVENLRHSVNQLFSGRSRVGALPPRGNTPDSPKTPRLPLGLGNFSSTRLQIPYLSRTNSISSIHSPIRSQHSRNPSTSSNRSSPSNPLRREIRHIPDNTVVPSGLPQAQYQPPRRFVGVDPEEQHLAELADAGRRGRRKSPSGHRTLFCGPKIKNRKIRSKILSCFVSGLFLVLVLTVYLALALTERSQSQEFHVLLILVILITTIFFCHSLVRLCMMIINPPREQDYRRRELPSMAGPGGFANPPVPIRVALARDEEAAGIETEATKMPPPAYGLWRESVRVDPNRIFWQRNNEPQPPTPQIPRPSQDRRPVTARPPSYMSDDGVDYVLEAEGRSTVPTVEVPLPVHPSERGRAWPRP